MYMSYITFNVDVHVMQIYMSYTSVYDIHMSYTSVSVQHIHMNYPL